MKHRFVGFALALALLASAGLNSMVSAQLDTEDVTVTGSVSTVLSIAVDPGAVSFGTGLNFLGGYNGDGNVQHICPSIIPNGARYLGPVVTVTVQSSSTFDFGRGVQDSSTVAGLEDRFHFNTYEYDCGAAPEESLSGFFTDPISCPAPAICSEIELGAAAGTKVHTEHYALDVSAGDPTGSILFAITYAVVATP